MNDNLLANKEIKSVYVSGPMTGYDMHNFPLFDATAAELRGNFYKCTTRGCDCYVSEKKFFVAKDKYNAEKKTYLKKRKDEDKSFEPFRNFTLCSEHPEGKMRKSPRKLKVVNPAELDEESKRIMKMEEIAGKPVIASGNKEWAALLKRDQKLVADVDAIVVLPNWQKSRGAKEEVRAAVGVNTPVYEVDTLKLLPTNQLPYYEAEGSILHEAIRITEGERGDAFVHPLKEYAEVAKLWSTIDEQKVTPENVALKKLLSNVVKLILAPSRKHAVDIAGYIRCIEMIAEELGGWHRLNFREGETELPEEVVDDH